MNMNESEYPVSFGQKMDAVLATMILEGSYDEATEDDQVTSLQYLIDTGVVWHLQGSYQRMAQHAIENGICSKSN
tara:strand:- start:123 stop:347 length:225 start_codon:yes stop_codon:yes gene_type:complete